MQEKNTQHRRLEQPNSTLDERLSSFYGPERMPQQLPFSSWQTLQRRLDKQPAQRSFYRIRHLRHRGRTVQHVPLAVRQAFTRILHEAHGPLIHSRTPEVRCNFKLRLREPVIHTTLFSRTIRLTLPAIANLAQDEAALDALLAAGLARYQLAQQWRYRWLYLLLLLLLVVDGTTLVLLHFYQQWFEFLISGIATASTVSTVAALYWQQRQRALQADMLAVHWLGRSRMCHGLHALANYSAMPYRRQWSEPSLAERIERVCGPRVEANDERLTLAR